MNAIHVALAAGVLAASFDASAQRFDAVESDPARRIATLESEVTRLRDELARLRSAPALHAPLPAWRPAPGAHPPLSPLQGQVAWLSPPVVAVVPPLGAAECASCPPCR
jgi:hypothetical protein